mmetsp:Transcript_37308/g.94083  ORF Transcript_37308/g.94083 Transcript_37308/m.94083 type:complete len:208 (-) Transcript_37308:249-872(-)
MVFGADIHGHLHSLFRQGGTAQRPYLLAVSPSAETALGERSRRKAAAAAVACPVCHPPHPPQLHARRFLPACLLAVRVRVAGAFIGTSTSRDPSAGLWVSVFELDIWVNHTAGGLPASLRWFRGWRQVSSLLHSDGWPKIRARRVVHILHPFFCTAVQSARMGVATRSKDLRYWVLCMAHDAGCGLQAQTNKACGCASGYGICGSCL